MILQLALAELQHVADDGDAASGDVGLMQKIERARERVRIGVVRVVVNRRAAKVRDDSAVIGRFQLAHAARDAIPRNADGARGGDRREKVLEIVAAGKSEIEFMIVDIE